MAFLFRREGPGLPFRFLPRTVARVWLSSSDPASEEASASRGGGGKQCHAFTFINKIHIRWLWLLKTVRRVLDQHCRLHTQVSSGGFLILNKVWGGGLEPSQTRGVLCSTFWIDQRRLSSQDWTWTDHPGLHIWILGSLFFARAAPDDWCRNIPQFLRSLLYS